MGSLESSQVGPGLGNLQTFAKHGTKLFKLFIFLVLQKSIFDASL